MAVVFNEKDSIFFVGGTGTKVGIVNPGGCTKTWYDANFTTLTDIMGADGAALIGLAACNYDHVDGPLGDRRINKADAGEFAAAEVGMVAYISGTNITTGRYEITGIDTVNGHYVLVAGIVATGDNADTVINIGGAFGSLQNTFDNTDAGSAYDVKIYSNVFNYQHGLTMDCNAGNGGSIQNNSHKIVEGFHTLPGDMNYGETYYQSPLDALINGVDIATPKCIRINASGGAYPAITIFNSDCWVFKNVYFYNTNKAAGNDCVLFATAPVNVGFVNCKFDIAFAFFSGSSYGVTFQRCYMGNDFGDTYMLTYPTLYGGSLDRCVLNGDGLTGFKIPKYISCSKTLFWKSGTGPFLYYPTRFDSCVFYGQTSYCIRLSSATLGMAYGQNNIFIPVDAADFVVYGTGAARGAVSAELLRNSCVWTLAGVQMTNHIKVNNIYHQLTDAIEEDPQFEDAVNGDFRLKINSPCLKTGMKTLGNL